MKTIQQIKNEIRDLEALMEQCARSGESGKAWIKKRTMALKALQFLELAPDSTEEYLSGVLATVSEKYYPLYYANPHLDHKGNPYKKRLHDAYEKQHGVKALREKKTFIEYILEK